MADKTFKFELLNQVVKESEDKQKQYDYASAKVQIATMDSETADQANKKEKDALLQATQAQLEVEKGNMATSSYTAQQIIEGFNQFAVQYGQSQVQPLADKLKEAKDNYNAVLNELLTAMTEIKDTQTATKQELAKRNVSEGEQLQLNVFSGFSDTPFSKDNSFLFGDVPELQEKINKLYYKGEE